MHNLPSSMDQPIPFPWARHPASHFQCQFYLWYWSKLNSTKLKSWKLWEALCNKRYQSTICTKDIFPHNLSKNLEGILGWVTTSLKFNCEKTGRCFPFMSNVTVLPHLLAQHRGIHLKHCHLHEHNFSLFNFLIYINDYGKMKGSLLE